MTSDENLGSIGGSVITKEKIVIDEKELMMSRENKNPCEWRKKLMLDLMNDLRDIIKSEEYNEGSDWISTIALLEKLSMLPSGKWKRGVLPTGKLTEKDLIRIISMSGIRTVRLKVDGLRRNFYRKEEFFAEASNSSIDEIKP